MNVLIAGGGYAGLACALRLAWRARAQGTPVHIRLVNPQPVLVERIRLHQAATGQRLRERRIDTMLQRCGVQLVTGAVEALDLQARTARVGTETHVFDRLVLATGSQPDVQGTPGAAEHAFTMAPGEVARLHSRLAALPAGARVVVVGGGLTGIESASEIAESFPQLKVSLVAQGRVAEGFSPAGRDHVLRTLGETMRISVHERVHVDSVAANELRTSQGAMPFDACIWAAGFSLPVLPRRAGLQVNGHGQVLVDPQLRSLSHPWVYAVGDGACPAIPPGQELPMGCKSAMPMGALAADNLAHELAGDEPEAFDYALLFYCVSLGRRDGLIQWADDDGRASARVLTGRRAAWFKEMICRSTWWALKWEAKGRKAVVWKRTGRAPEALAAA